MRTRSKIIAFLLVIMLPGLVSGAPVNSEQTKKPAIRTPSVNILSIIPAQAEPGAMVTLYGSGFTEGTTAFLGNTALPTRILGAQQLTFTMPNLAPGLYALFLKREDGSVSKIYNFSILPLKPILSDLTPDRVFVCGSGREREVLVSGRNFQEQSRIFFDGAAISSRYLSNEALSFSVPDVAGGLHQVQVKNPGDTNSIVMALFIDAKPEILSVTQGEEYVNSYNLIITGKNFQQNSELVVDGKRLSAINSYASERERVIYNDCNQIIYVRYPYDPTTKNFRIQVVNPGGEASAAVQVSAP